MTLPIFQMNQFNPLRSNIVNTQTARLVISLSVLFASLLAACSKPYEFNGRKLEYTRPVVDAAGVDQFGEPFQLSDYEGKYVLVNFGYTSCPDICPLTLQNIARFYNQLAEQDPDLANQVEVIFVTVDPKRDVPERLEQYVGAFHDSFTGLYIEDEEALQTTKESFAVFSQIAEDSDPEAENYFVDHTGGIFVLNPEGEWTIFFSPNIDSEEILADMNELLRG